MISMDYYQLCAYARNLILLTLNLFQYKSISLREKEVKVPARNSELEWTEDLSICKKETIYAESRL